MLNLTSYAEISIQESLSWTKNKCDFLSAREKEIVKVAMETTEITKPGLARKGVQNRYSMKSGCRLKKGDYSILLFQTVENIC